MVRTGRRDQDGKWQKLTIEDARIPTSISSLFGELLTTGAFSIDSATRSCRVVQECKGYRPHHRGPKAIDTRKSCL